MGNARVVLNRRAVREILRSQRVADELARRARRIAARAGADADYRVDVEVGRNRARAAVITQTPQAREAEAHHRTLTRAIDAGR